MKACAQGHSQPAAKGACEPGLCPVCPPPRQPPSGCGFISPWRLDLSCGWVCPPLFPLPLPIPSLKGQVRPSLPRACPCMALLFQNVAKFINSPFPETRNSLCRVQRGGRAGSVVGGLDLSPGPGPMSAGVGLGPRPSLRLSFPTYRAKKRVSRSFLQSFPSLDTCSVQHYKWQCSNQGPEEVLGGGLQLLLHDFLPSFFLPFFFFFRA